jgi:hypothetical protein
MLENKLETLKNTSIQVLFLILQPGGFGRPAHFQGPRPGHDGQDPRGFNPRFMNSRPRFQHGNNMGEL